LPGRAGPGKLAKMSALAPPIAPVDLLGVPVHPLTLAEAVAHLAEAIARRRPTTVVSLNGALLMRVLRDPQVRDAVRVATLVIPDGIGVLLAARILGVPVRRRVAGVDLTETLCAAVAPRRGRVFLLGAAPGVADAAAAQLRQRCPGLEVAGTAHGFFPPEDEPALLARIRRAAPDILLVAFGAPRQEDWMRRYGASLSVPVTMSAGRSTCLPGGRAARRAGCRPRAWSGSTGWFASRGGGVWSKPSRRSSSSRCGNGSAADEAARRGAARRQEQNRVDGEMRIEVSIRRKI